MSNFPKDIKLPCRLKWGWSTIYLAKGTTASCHRVWQDQLTVENFKNFHNIPRKISDRESMIRGEWPGGGCEYCKKIEDAGGFSDRQFHLMDQFDELTAKELFTNPIATQVNPTLLEVYFNNTCNLKCLYCGPWFSSKIEDEIRKHGPYDKTTSNWTWEKNENYDNMVQQLWEWLDENYRSLRHFHILGGEPFMQTEFTQVLDFFDSHPNPEMEFNIVTNLSIGDKIMDQYITRLTELIENKKIKLLQITASIDCWGPHQEYIRSGLNLVQWEKNFKKIIQIPNVRIQVNHAISALGVKYMADFYRKYSEWSANKEIYINFMTVQSPDYLNPEIFGPDILTNDFAEILSLMPEHTPYFKKIKSYMDGIAKQVEASTLDLNRLAELKAFLETIDYRRKTNYKVLFPWLEELFLQFAL